MQATTVYPADKIVTTLLIAVLFLLIAPIAKANNAFHSPHPNIIPFAKQWLGVKYQYGAAHPKQGFDCSGFVFYVFKQFNITVPRSSAAIGQVGKPVKLEEAIAGDIILFTGTNPRKRQIGHVGIIVSNDGGQTKFIHASSGKAMAVTETLLEGSYKRRFIKVIRVSS